MTALSGRVVLGARRVWGKLGNLLGLLSPLLVTSVSFACVVSRRQGFTLLAHLLPQGGRGGFKVYVFDFTSLGQQNFESNLSKFVAVQPIAGLFRFLLLFVLIPSLDLREHLIRILEGLGGQVSCHMYSWALGGSRRSLFGWLVLCSVGASRRCYLGVSNSHLLLSRSGSNWCNTAHVSNPV